MKETGPLSRRRLKRTDAVERRAIVLLALLGLALLVIVLQRPVRPGPALVLEEAAYARAEVLFQDLVADPSSDAPAGFSIARLDQPFAGVLVQEPSGRCKGGGGYLLRSAGPNVPLLISAPHRGTDKLTGTIALRLFLEGRAQAAAWNTVPRRDCGSDTGDLARLTRHPFTAFSVAFARTHKQGRVVQIHGFDQARRATVEARAATVILSAGAEQVTPAVLAVAECLRARIAGERVAVYPHDVRELGARRNVQGRELRRIGFTGFIHAELSLDFRQRLADDKDLRSRFRACLETGL